MCCLLLIFYYNLRYHGYRPGEESCWLVGDLGEKGHVDKITFTRIFHYFTAGEIMQSHTNLCLTTYIHACCTENTHVHTHTHTPSKSRQTQHALLKVYGEGSKWFYTCTPEADSMPRTWVSQRTENLPVRVYDPDSIIISFTLSTHITKISCKNEEKIKTLFRYMKT